ncbi:MAG: FRG domain-containing protein [Methylobacter sp.]|nr:FRG domain-containing protein [Methylobacter sp.]MDP2427746.1 FRG domain-containing protein [Methylobacter sp.]MDP3053951.1 FRG domain-containing protein [Methylobacter sp.]MDP3361682.1 FRG domain-containing protein [Methylobacter sp.]
MKEIEADGDISSFINALKEDFGSIDLNEETWFRGQSDYVHKLIPSLFRYDVNKASSTLDYDEVVMYDEAEIYAEFIRRYPEHSNSHKNVFEWLTLMQHYRLPTRLLDWSTNLLVALFFCCNEEQDKDKDGAIFAFNPYVDLSLPDDFRKFLEIQVTSYDKIIFYEQLIKLAEKEFGEETKINKIKIKDIKSDLGYIVKAINNGTGKFESFGQMLKMQAISLNDYDEKIDQFSKTYSYKPPHLNPRIRQQHGCFTFHGGKYFEGSEFIQSLEMDQQYSLIKIRVKHDVKQKLLHELALSGISEATLFPEMEYQSKQIKDRYKKAYKLIPGTQFLY